MDTIWWILFGALTITVFGCGWAKEYARRLTLEHDLAGLDAQLTASEGERLKLDAAYQRLRAEAARRRGQDLPPRPLRLIDGAS